MRLPVLLAILSLATACKERESSPAAPPARSATPAPASPRCPPGQRICVGDALVQCTAAGALGDPLPACAGGCRDGACVDTCAVHDVELIYVVDDGANLYAFDPTRLPGDPFRRIATLTCDSTSTVNSMAVDRAGIAWLGYHNGKIHRASIIDGRCAAAGAAPRDAPETFGMGFVSDGPKATTEKLFVAGGRDRTKSLATLDTTATPARWTPIAALTIAGGHPELTGTGDGRVFAYFPEPGRGFIQELDRGTAAPIGPRWTLADGAHQVSAYAFAHWGGVFYVFTTADDNSAVHAVRMTTGKQERVMTDLPMRIVGAGVSTCAPLLERVP